MTIQIKATEKYFPVILIIDFESVDEILTVQTLLRNAMMQCCLLHCGTVNDNDRNKNRTFSF